MMQEFNIIDLFLKAAEENPARTAIVYKNERISFGDFKTQVAKTAAYFQSKNIVAGDRVLVFVPMSIDLYRIALALFYMGATAVFLDEWVSKKRMEECCRIAQCKAFVGVWKVRLLSLFSSELRRIPVKLGLNYSADNGTHQEKYRTSLTDTALITFTTGTTGTPKAAKRTHGFLKEQFEALIEKIQPVDGETDMPALPIVLMINLGAGCTSVIADFKASKPDALDASKIIDQIRSNRVERLVASPFFVRKLAEFAIEGNIAASSLKKIFTGGAPVFPEEAALYQAAFPSAKIEIVYGSTEAEPISSVNASELVKDETLQLNKGLKVGIPYRKANVRIIKMKEEPLNGITQAELEELTLEDGVIGEIIVSGPHVLREYFNNQEALHRNKIFIGDNCWHRTGDSGYLESGCLYLTGRVNTLMYRNGEILSPFMYQNYLQSLPGVVLGTIIEKDKKLMVVLELEKSAEKEKVLDRIQKLPVQADEIKILTAIPRDPRHHSRIEYERLMELL